MTERPHLFPALLKYWRRRRGLSQLDLGLHADVSARHISFLETGRSAPSEGMILRLADTLEVPLRQQNELLRAGGFEPLFDEPNLDVLAEPAIAMAIDRMLAQHDPFPMVVLDGAYNLLKTNASADRMMLQLVADPSALTPPLNVMELLFDPRLIRPFIDDWEQVGQEMFSRVYREALRRPEDGRLMQLIHRLLEYPDVPAEWRHPDFSRGHEVAFSIRLTRDDLSLHFLTTITSFSSANNVTLEELRIESYFPMDTATEEACAAPLG